MTKTFVVGDHVSWNSEAGRVRGRILRVHRKDVNYKGYVHHASPDDPADRLALMQALATAEPFNRYPGLIQEIVKSESSKEN